jgi:hypothetical protein
MFYTVYKITNLVNDKIYIGVHRTSNLDDDYMGSGINIKRAIKKYGIDNFKKEYLAIFDNEEKMFEMESSIVNTDFIKSSDTYNINEGGQGSWVYLNSLPQDVRSERGRVAGSWKDKEKRIKICDSIPMEKRKQIGKRLGDEYGGLNELTSDEIERRFELIMDINLLEYGWVRKVSDRLGLTHTQVKRFIEKHYKGEFYRRVKK